MILKYQGNDIELVYSFRSSIYFEQIQGKNLDFSQFTSNDTITLFYCVFIASLQKNKMPICSMLDFLDIVDDNGGEKAILDFTDWYINIMKSQLEVFNMTNDVKEEEKPSKKKKKN